MFMNLLEIESFMMILLFHRLLDVPVADVLSFDFFRPLNIELK
jgi:hypothetical protein